jgi:hypothetical protein
MYKTKTCPICEQINPGAKCHNCGANQDLHTPAYERKLEKYQWNETTNNLSDYQNYVIGMETQAYYPDPRD